MKIACIIILLGISLHGFAAPADSCKTPDELIKAFYACLDVQPGQKIDSARFVNLFWPGTKLEGVTTSRKDSSRLVNFSITVDKYLQGMEQLTKTNRFKEWETGREELSYGHMKTIYSSYELADTSPDGKTTSIKGVNTFHLFYDGSRWWITYCSYEDEGDAVKMKR